MYHKRVVCIKARVVFFIFRLHGIAQSSKSERQKIKNLHPRLCLP